MAEHELVVWAEAVADTIAEADALKQAESGSEKLLAKVRGRVISSEEDAAEVTDLVKSVRVGQRSLKESLDSAMAPLKQAMARAKDRLATLNETLSAADKAGVDSLKAWQREKESRRLAEEARIRRERDEAERLAREAEAAGMEVAPPVEEVPEPPPSKSTYGAKGQSFGTKPLCCELLDPHAAVSFLPDLLSLNATLAKALYREAEKRQEVESMTQHPSGGVVWHGIRFWREQSVAIR